jgi:hypothetical protein
MKAKEPPMIAAGRTIGHTGSPPVQWVYTGTAAPVRSAAKSEKRKSMEGVSIVISINEGGVN